VVRYKRCNHCGGEMEATWWETDDRPIRIDRDCWVCPDCNRAEYLDGSETPPIELEECVWHGTAYWIYDSDWAEATGQGRMLVTIDDENDRSLFEKRSAEWYRSIWLMEEQAGDWDE